jgi:hypothetical protein
MVTIDAQWMPLLWGFIRNLTFHGVPELYPADYDNPEKSERGYTWKSWKIFMIPTG